MDDPDGIMGDNWASDSFYAEGKYATLYVPLFEWVTPKESPVTSPDDLGQGKNQFIYDSAANGVLQITLEVSVLPSNSADLLADRCKFNLPEINGSIFAWAEANLDGKPTASGNFLTATATYTNLPQANSSFGAKQAEFSCESDSSFLPKGDFEVFFMKDATNHPGGQLGTPNWFYYWSQFLPMGRIAILQYGNIAGYGETVSVNRTTTVSQLASVTNDETENHGLHAFYETLVHESHHIELWEDWWGVGGIPNAQDDTDADNYPDDFELSEIGVLYGFTVPFTDDSFAAGEESAGHIYEEEECRFMEHLILVTEFDSQDWSYHSTNKGKNQ